MTILIWLKRRLKRVQLGVILFMVFISPTILLLVKLDRDSRQNAARDDGDSRSYQNEYVDANTVKGTGTDKLHQRNNSHGRGHGRMRTAAAAMHDRLESFESRQVRVSTLCKQYHLGKYKFPNGTNSLNLEESPTPQYSYFFVNSQHRFAWCPVYKAGSTSWLHNMMILAGFAETEIANPPKQLSIWTRDIYGDGAPDEMFTNSKKLLIVRHPFSRLVSAYRDKLSNASLHFIDGTSHYYEKYGRRIVSKFRPSNSTLTQKEPTFSEFVNYLISTNIVYYDDHWLPVYFSCTPCLLVYDFIGKVETYNEDQLKVIEQMHWQDKLKPKWKHKTSDDNHDKNSAGAGTAGRADGSSTTTTSQLLRNYMESQLTQIQIDRLYEKYRLDFELFGYKMFQ